jgi:hypothetical protein
MPHDVLFRYKHFYSSYHGLNKPLYLIQLILYYKTSRAHHSNFIKNDNCHGHQNWTHTSRKYQENKIIYIILN